MCFVPELTQSLNFISTQSPSVLLLVDLGDAEEVEVSSISKESEEEAEDEEAFYFKPLNANGVDFTMAVDQ